MISLFSRRWFVLILSIPIGLFAQSETPVFWEQNLLVNHQWKQRWSLNSGLSYRALVASDLSNFKSGLYSKHIQASINTGLDVGFYGKLSVGLMYRFNNIERAQNKNELRLVQQYSFGKKYNAIRLVHRLRVDERIIDNMVTFRPRYRFSFDFPLGGLRVDPEEWYLVFSSEILANFTHRLNPQWDQRITVRLGHQWNRNLKIELHGNYRWEDYFNTTQNRLFVRTALIYKI